MGKTGWCLWQGKQGLLVTTGTKLLLLKNDVSELRCIQLQPHAIVHTPLMFMVQNRLLLGDNRWNIWLRTFAISTGGQPVPVPFFLPERVQRFRQIFCGDKAMHCLHFANINRG